jgi:hypothetical protein
MQRSTDRILTTHAGSLARPANLLAMVRAKEAGQPYDHAAFAARVRTAVARGRPARERAALGVRAGAGRGDAATGAAYRTQRRATCSRVPTAS